MPAITALVLADGQSTPANKTFTPSTAQKGAEPAVWLEKSSGNSLGFRRITLSVVADKAINRVKIVIADPVLANPSQGCCVDANTPAVSYTDFANISFNIPASASVANRKDILAYAKNLLGHAIVTAAVVDLEPTW